jgi:hypothetical protein
MSDFSKHKVAFYRSIDNFQKELVDVEYYVRLRVMKSCVKRNLYLVEGMFDDKCEIIRFIKREIDFILDGELLRDFNGLLVTSRVLGEL